MDIARHSGIALVGPNGALGLFGQEPLQLVSVAGSDSHRHTGPGKALGQVPAKTRSRTHYNRGFGLAQNMPPFLDETLSWIGNYAVESGPKLPQIMHKGRPLPGLITVTEGLSMRLERSHHLTLLIAALLTVSGPATGENGGLPPFSAADTDGDGYLTLEEAKRIGISPQRFCEEDLDRDGRIDTVQYQFGIKNDVTAHQFPPSEGACDVPSDGEAP